MSSTEEQTIEVSHVITAPTIQTHSFHFGGRVNSGEWSLAEGSGVRRFEAEIEFKQPFRRTPQVVLTMTGLDAERTRIEIEASNVTRERFTFSARTWADSKIYSVYGTWIAICPD